MATITVAILGLGRVGVSIGLALKRAQADRNVGQQFAITGFDSTDDGVQAAKTRGAIDTSARAAPEAAANKDIVVLSLPYSETAAAISAISGALRAGAVVLDCAPLKLPSIGWARAAFNPGSTLIGITPILNPAYLFDGADDAAHAAADLFDKGALLIAPDERASREAIDLAADFADLIGAIPYFVDPAEHDGWAAATDGLPALIAAAAFAALRNANGWDDIQKTGSAAFGRLTHHLYDTHPDDLRELLLNNRDNLVRQTDALILTLQALRDRLAANDRPALDGTLQSIAKDYEAWIGRRYAAKWTDEGAHPALPEGKADAIMTGLLGGALAKRLRRRNGQRADS